MPAQFRSHVFFIGGGGDKELETHIVKSLHDDFKKAVKQNANITAEYYGWYEEDHRDKVSQKITQLRESDPSIYIAVVGHSYGGSAAVKAIQNLDKKKAQGLETWLAVNLLITLDPVSRVHRCPKKRPQSVQYWINVDAEADDYSLNDFVATLGGNWGDAVKGLADVYFNSKCDHADADGMMKKSYAHEGAAYTAWGVLMEYVQWGASSRDSNSRGGFIYTVLKNDTLWGISSDVYGKGAYWWLIRDANPGVLPQGSTLIQPGMRLLIPRVLEEVVVTANARR